MLQDNKNELWREMRHPRSEMALASDVLYQYVGSTSRYDFKEGKTTPAWESLQGETPRPRGDKYNDSGRPGATSQALTWQFPTRPFSSYYSNGRRWAD
jgi:hypothetical protein